MLLSGPGQVNSLAKRPSPLRGSLTFRREWRPPASQSMCHGARERTGETWFSAASSPPSSLRSSSPGNWCSWRAPYPAYTRLSSCSSCWSRPPVYLGEIATAIGVTLATAGWLSAIAIVYFIVCELLRIRWEERILALTFPNEYPEYARSVPRYLPNPFARG